MRNRQIIDLPATLADAESVSNLLYVQPCDLKVRDVTYLHFHREFELGLCLSGEGTLFHGESDRAFLAGDVQLICPYMRHIHRTDQGELCRWVWIYVNAEALLSALGIQDFSRLDAMLSRVTALSGLIDRAAHPELCSKIKSFAQKCSGEGYADPEHMALDFYGILLAAVDACPKDDGAPSSFAGMAALDPALRRIASDIEKGGGTSVEDLAGLCAMSVSGFRRIFTEVMGASPKMYIQACRIRRAKQLLRRDEMNVLDIAFAVGYKDISGFNRCFLDIVGETPSAYRKRHR